MSRGRLYRVVHDRPAKEEDVLGNLLLEGFSEIDQQKVKLFDR